LCENRGKENDLPSTPSSGFVSGPDFSRAVEAHKDLGFSRCLNCIPKHFLLDARWQGLQPDLFRFLCSPTKVGP